MGTQLTACCCAPLRLGVTAEIPAWSSSCSRAQEQPHTQLSAYLKQAGILHQYVQRHECRLLAVYCFASQRCECNADELVVDCRR